MAEMEPNFRLHNFMGSQSSSSLTSQYGTHTPSYRHTVFTGFQDVAVWVLQLHQLLFFLLHGWFLLSPGPHTEKAPGPTPGPLPATHPLQVIILSFKVLDTI